LQDLSLGYGEDVSRYTQGKRSVADEDIGPLISTDMTRCIHCTRCVRFGQEVAGISELGATGRGEHMEIGTYVKHSLVSELSGNIIDLCPVGALTSKPYRFTARAWELNQSSSISPHDCVGSHLKIHQLRNVVKRVIPRNNEKINECWISDRDRFSYTGLQSDDRLGAPLVKRSGNWQAADWSEALHFAVDGIKQALATHGDDNVAGLASPISTTEELFLFQKLLRALGAKHVDHRIHESDFADQSHVEVTPTFEVSIEDIEKQQAVLLVGSNIQKEQPMLSHRVRNASLQQAKIHVINSIDYEFNFDVTEKIISKVSSLVNELAALLLALGSKASEHAEAIQTLLNNSTVSETHQRMADDLKQAENALLIIGSQAHNSPHASILRYLAKNIAKRADAKVACLTEGPNCAGASVAGVLPHRGVNGSPVDKIGLDAKAMFEQPRECYVLLNVEPEYDCANAKNAIRALKTAEFVVVLSPFKTAAMESYADVILPIAPFTETAGTYVNCEGKWQSFKAAVKPLDEARPAWKVLRVLGNLFNVEEFTYETIADVTSSLRSEVEANSCQIDDKMEVHFPTKTDSEDVDCLTVWPMYCVDQIVRRAKPLQEVAVNERPMIYLSENLAEKFNVKDNTNINVSQGNNKANMQSCIDKRLPNDSVMIPAGFRHTADLGSAFTNVKLRVE